MKNIILIGAGQIGSRHLQSLSDLKGEVNIYVIDPSNDSLRLSKERFEKVNQNKFIKLNLSTEFDVLPHKADIAIIATSADVRGMVTKELLRKCVVNYIVFEKVAFQSIAEFHVIIDLLEQRNIKAWVNCTRRMWQGYHNLKKILGESTKLAVHVSGGEWGMACNSLHFFDLVGYLVGDSTYSLETKFLDKAILNSKRRGFKEVTGTLIATYQNGSQAFLISMKNSTAPISISITGEKIQVLIDEVKSEINVRTQENNWIPENLSLQAIAQSKLSSVFISDILKYGSCTLTTINDSFTIHQPLLNGLCKFISAQTNENIQVCPIT